MPPYPPYFLVGREVIPRRGCLRGGDGSLLILRQGDDLRLVARKAQQHAGEVVLRLGGKERTRAMAFSRSSVMLSLCARFAPARRETGGVAARQNETARIIIDRHDGLSVLKGLRAECRNRCTTTSSRATK